jgi:hypothetical protein
MEVLGLELEEVRLTPTLAKVAITVDGQPTVVRTRNKPSNKKYAPKTHYPPAPVSPGFVYQDRGFWQVRWREHGHIYRAGLATKDEAVAQNCLRILREEGPEALRDEVRKRKRIGASVYYDGSRGKRSFYLLSYDEESLARVKQKLYTQDRANAEAILEARKRGDLSEVSDRISANIQEWDERAPAQKAARHG